MLFLTTCRRVESWADASVRGELDAASDATLRSHVETCAPCAESVDEARRAYEVVRTAVRGDVFDLFGQEQLDEMRRETMAAVARVASERATPEREASDRAPLRAVGSGLVAASVAALAMMAGPAFERGTYQSSPVGVATSVTPVEHAAKPSLGEEMSIATAETVDGTVVSWQGEGLYRVVRSDRPNMNGGNLTVKTVCGTNWTDLERPVGMVFYRVVAEGSCPRNHA